MHDNIRSRKILDIAYQFDCMLEIPGICEGGPGEPAHSNQAKHGKGGAMKAHDIYHVPACRSCHRELDHGKTMTREERRELWEAAFWEYLPLLFKGGHLKAEN